MIERFWPTKTADPSPAEIAETCEAIRSSWSPMERERRNNYPRVPLMVQTCETPEEFDQDRIGGGI